MQKFTFNTSVILFLFLALGIGLRMYKLDRFGIWGDEQWAVSSSVGLKYAMFSETPNFWNQWSRPWQNKWWESDTSWNGKREFTSNDFWKFNTAANVMNATVYNSNSGI